MNSDGTELEQVVHTLRKWGRSGWPRGFGEVNSSPQSWIFNSIQVDCSPRTKPITDRWSSIFEIGVEQLRSVTELNHRSCVWTEAPSGVVFAQAQLLSSIMSTYPKWLYLLSFPTAITRVDFPLHVSKDSDVTEQRDKAQKSQTWLREKTSITRLEQQ